MANAIRRALLARFGRSVRFWRVFRRQRQAVVALATLAAIMGTPMAEHLLGAGFDVAVHDIAPARVLALATRGAKVLPSPAAVARESDSVICMSNEDLAAKFRRLSGLTSADALSAAVLALADAPSVGTIAQRLRTVPVSDRTGALEDAA